MNKNQITICVIIEFIIAAILLILGSILIGLVEIVIPFNPIPLGIIFLIIGGLILMISFVTMSMFLVD